MPLSEQVMKLSFYQLINRYDNYRTGGEVNGDCSYHTEAATATFLPSTSSMVTGSPSGATVNLRIIS